MDGGGPARKDTAGNQRLVRAIKGWYRWLRQLLQSFSSFGAVASPFAPRYILHVRREARFVAEFTDRPAVRYVQSFRATNGTGPPDPTQLALTITRRLIVAASPTTTLQTYTMASRGDAPLTYHARSERIAQLT
jgi:hypothetical protein